MTSALEAGYEPSVRDWATAVEALDAHGTENRDRFVTLAVEAFPTDRALRDLVGKHAELGSSDARRRAEELAKRGDLSLAERFALLLAALEGADRVRDVESALRIAGDLDDIVLRDGKPKDGDLWSGALATNETLRLALDPPQADALRIEVLRRFGRIEEARAQAELLFYRAADGSLPDFDPAEILESLVELGASDADVEDLRRLARGVSPVSKTSAPQRLVFVGGNEAQQRYVRELESWLDAEHGGTIKVDWFILGWGSNWDKHVDSISSALATASAVVVMTFVRTHLGRWVRRAASDAGLPWISCTGHGLASLRLALSRAIEVGVATSERKRVDG